LPPKRSLHRPGISRALGLRARSDDRFVLAQAEHLTLRKDLFMSEATLCRCRSRIRQAPWMRARLCVEELESRDVPSALHLTPLVPVSGVSPFLGNPIEANDPTITIDSEVEPYVAVDPTNSNHLVGTWNQDFARGIVAAVSFNGGNTWQSVVVPGVTAASGGVYPHSSNAWVSFAPNRDVYLSLIAHDFPPFGDAVLVCKSTDGGLTWSAPTTLATAGSNDFHDKECITADPTNPQFVYASWVRYDNNRGVTMFSRTTDGGQTWEPAREIFDAGPKTDTIGHQIVVLPDGTLVNFFDLGASTSTAGVAHFENTLSLIRSTDHGESWSAPIPVADVLSLFDTATIPGTRGVPNPDGGSGVFAPNTFFDVAVDPAKGNLYAVWGDARFGSFQYNSIAFSMSTDGGFTWSAPIKINQTPDNISAGNRQAILPSVAVNQDGVVAVTYYDFRNNTPNPGLPTDLWMVHAHPADGLTNGASWSSENRMTSESFNMENAPLKEGGYFIGDYEGLAAMGKNFGAFFSMPTATRSGSIFFRDPAPGATPVGAPEIQSFHFDHTLTDTYLCGFPVLVHDEGDVRIAVHTDLYGKLAFVNVSASNYRITLTNLASGESLSSPSPEHVRATLEEQIHTGLVSRFVMPGIGLLSLDAGRLVFGEDGVSISGPHMLFEGDVDALCAALVST
jgi:hypothetical protein